MALMHTDHMHAFAGWRTLCAHVLMASKKSEVMMHTDDWLMRALERELPRACAHLTVSRDVRRRVHCFACTCSSKKCFRCMQQHSAIKAYDRAHCYKMICPNCVDGGGIGRASSHVRAFSAAVWQVFPTACIVWDWNCLKHDSSVSIDATVLSGHGCAQYEIDGSGHFFDNLTNRQTKDETKDKLINDQQLCVLRLHFRDQEQWAEYIKMHMYTRRPCVQYTRSYLQCLRGEKAADMIMQL